MDTSKYTTALEGAEQDSVRGLVYATAPPEIDDLTRIRGVGTVLQEQLNRNGVYRYEQIAQWDSRNIEEFARLLSCFKDRIERNYWVWQAQKLIDERESENGMYSNRTTRSHTALPASLLRTAIVLCLSLMLGMLFVHWLQLREARTFSGNVYAQSATIKATRDAEVGRVFVADGDIVETQQDVVVLRDDSLKQLIVEKRREVEKLARELDNAVAKSEMDLKWKLHGLDKEILENRLIAANKLQTVSLKTADSSFADGRFKEVSHRRFTSDADEDKVRIEEEEYRPLIYFRPDNEGDDAVKAVIVRRVAPAPKKTEPTVSPERRRLCEARIQELQSMKDGLAQRIRQATGIDVCETRHAHALAELNEYEQQPTEFALKTTRAGTVTQVMQAAGSRVRKGDSLIQIMDPAMRFIVVKVPAKDVGRFEAGREVDVIFSGDHKRTARIEPIPFEVATASHSGEPVVSVTLVPSGRLWPAVPIGAGVEVRARR